AFNFSLYIREVENMVDFELSKEEKERFTEIMRNTEVANEPTGRPDSVLIYGDVKFIDNESNPRHFGLYKNENNKGLYVNFNHITDEVYWYEIKDDDMYNFLLEIEEQNPS
ncbi:MAG: hypothetical protein ABWY25_03105, partial [Paenisporosarcina sp.]